MGLGEEMRFHGELQLVAAGAGLEVEAGVERVEPEEVAVGLSRRRTRAAIADALEVVDALTRAIVEHFDLGGVLGKERGAGGDVPEEPVSPGSGGRVWIVGDEGEGLGSGGDFGPVQCGREAGAIAGVARGDRAAVGECG